jgi:hypothetical protein
MKLICSNKWPESQKFIWAGRSGLNILSYNMLLKLQFEQQITERLKIS